MGSDRVDTVVIVGGRDAEVITSADWTPAIGDQYAVVATPALDGTLRTELCFQQLVTPIVHDRVSLLGCAETVEASDVQATIQDALDTQG